MPDIHSLGRVGGSGTEWGNHGSPEESYDPTWGVEEDVPKVMTTDLMQKNWQESAHEYFPKPLDLLLMQGDSEHPTVIGTSVQPVLPPSRDRFVSKENEEGNSRRAQGNGRPGPFWVLQGGFLDEEYSGLVVTMSRRPVW